MNSATARCGLTNESPASIQLLIGLSATCNHDDLEGTKPNIAIIFCPVAKAKTMPKRMGGMEIVCHISQSEIPPMLKLNGLVSGCAQWQMSSIASPGMTETQLRPRMAWNHAMAIVPLIGCLYPGVSQTNGQRYQLQDQAGHFKYLYVRSTYTG